MRCLRREENVQTLRYSHIFNLGHGLLPETDPDKVDKLVKFYRNF